MTPNVGLSIECENDSPLKIATMLQNFKSKPNRKTIYYPVFKSKKTSDARSQTPIRDILN
jgi:hypothetical protein